jgi:Methyltransferase domain
MILRTLRIWPVLVLGAVTLVACAEAQVSTPPQLSTPPLDVPYVPTPEPVVAQMLKMAKIRRGDVVYDLGSGDGRIVITAARQFGTRGVGFDIDPARIREANDNAEKAGVSDKVTFVQEDIFKADIRPATVVTLYLLPDINLKLRPKLLRDLRPGTRVVSHNYDMGDWKPLETARLTVSGSEHTVYFWVVPAPTSR